jgi:hypothetical protein
MIKENIDVTSNFITTYLTKTEEGKTHHFRATVDNNGVSIVHGIFYIWLEKYFEGCGDNDSAITRQKDLINEKLREGFKITDFIETLENTTDVYDKAKWHFDGDFPKELDDFQGYVHTGMFLGWLVDNGLKVRKGISDIYKSLASHGCHSHHSGIAKALHPRRADKKLL